MLHPLCLPPNDQQHLILFINEKLPLRASAAHPHFGLKLCPSCQWEPEDAQYFLVCQNSDCKLTFRTLKSEFVRLTTKEQLHPCIHTALWPGMLAICMDTQYPDIIQDLPPSSIAPYKHKHILAGNKCTMADSPQAGQTPSIGSIQNFQPQATKYLQNF